MLVKADVSVRRKEKEKKTKDSFSCLLQTRPIGEKESVSEVRKEAFTKSRSRSRRGGLFAHSFAVSITASNVCVSIL